MAHNIRVEPEKVAALNRGRVVRLSIPAEVAFDLDRFQKTAANLAERLGCLPCLSGAACFFEFEDSFVVNPAGEVLPEGPALHG